MASLIYIADPMCSWCYGFGPELTQLLEGLPGTPLEIVAGGLRANNREVMNPELKATMLAHWQRVHEVSGLPFRDDGMSKDGFIYDTEPACRAVVAARTLAPQTMLAVFQAIQHAFYAEGQDVTHADVLANVASDAMTKAGFPIDAAGFLQAWASDSALAATAADFSQTKLWGVTGFPTLVLQRGEMLDLVTAGYVKVEVLVDKLLALIEPKT